MSTSLSDVLLMVQKLLRQSPKPPVRWTRRKYKKYLRSPWWQAKRNEKLSSQRYLCERCKDYATEVHHTHYNSLGAEELTDLEAICRRCHKKEHNIKRRRPHKRSTTSAPTSKSRC